MPLTDHQKRYQKLRRARMRRRGICVDCQLSPAKAGKNPRGKAYTCCESCLQARRDRWHRGTMPPLSCSTPGCKYSPDPKIERVTG